MNTENTFHFSENENAEKIIKNAVASYLMILINSAFFISKDKNVHHTFVLNHTKKAIAYHIYFLITYVVFVHFSFLGNFSYNNFFANKIISSLLFVCIFMYILRSMYLASKGIEAKNVHIFNILKINVKSEDVKKEEEIEVEEKEKLTILLSYIPFLSPFIKLKNNENIQNSLKISLYIGFVILLLFSNGKTNILLILLLLYSVFVAFVALILFIKSELFSPSLEKILFPSELYRLVKNIFGYLKNYFSEKFVPWNNFISEKRKADEVKIESEIKTIENLDNFSMNTSLIYIPLLNVLTFKKINTKLRNQIINLLGFTFIFSITLIFGYISNDYTFSLMFVYPYLYLLGNKNNNLYKSPVIYDVGHLLYSIFLKTDGHLDTIKKLKNKEEKVSFTVENK